MTKMNKCRNCGAFVAVEKAFCPNCSEPIEPEEAPNRAASSSSDMMATLRDDPEAYKEMLQSLKDKKSAEAAASNPGPAHATSPSVVGYSSSQIMPEATAPPVKSKKRGLGLIIVALSILIIIFVILLTLKVI